MSCTDYPDKVQMYYTYEGTQNEHKTIQIVCIQRIPLEPSALRITNTEPRRQET